MQTSSKRALSAVASHCCLVLALQQLLGGFAGGIGGGILSPGGGFPGSIIFSVIGQKIDEFVANLGGLADSLGSATATFEALETSGFKVSSQLKLQVRLLEEVGQGEAARAVALEEVKDRLGAGGVQQLSTLNEQQEILRSQWEKLASLLQQAVLPVLIVATDVLFMFGDGIKNIVGIFEALAGLGQSVGKLFADITTSLVDLSDTAIGSFFSFLGDELKKFVGIGRDNKPKEPSAEEKFANRQKQIQESRRQADFIRNAEQESLQLSREAFDIAQQEADVWEAITDQRRAWEKEIYDIRKRADEESFKAAQSEARLRIEQVRLELQQASTGQGSEEQRLLGALSEYLTQREQGELAIEEKRRQIRVAIADLEFQLQDFEIKTAKEVERISRQINAYNRSVEDYKVKVAEYQLKIQREIEDSVLRSAAAMMNSMTSGMGGMGGPGGNTLMGVPGVVEYLTGDRSSPGYRADHGGDNYHEHIAFASREIRDNVANMLRANGIQVGSLDRPGDPGYHGSGQVLDVPASQVPVGQEDALARKVRMLVTNFLGGNTRAGMGGGTPGANFSNFANFLSEIESKRNPTAKGPDSPEGNPFGYFQAKPAFRQEAREITGSDIWSTDYAESQNALKGWIQNKMPDVFEAIGRADWSYVFEKLGANYFTSLPGASGANPGNIGRAMPLLTASGPGQTGTNPYAQAVSNIKFPDKPSFNKIPLGETPDPAKVLEDYRRAYDSIRNSLKDQLSTEEGIQNILEEQNQERFKAAIIGTSKLRVDGCQCPAR